MSCKPLSDISLAAIEQRWKHFHSLIHGPSARRDVDALVAEVRRLRGKEKEQVDEKQEEVAVPEQHPLDWLREHHPERSDPIGTADTTLHKMACTCREDCPCDRCRGIVALDALATAICELAASNLAEHRDRVNSWLQPMGSE